MLISTCSFLYNILVDFLIVFNLIIWGCIGVFVLKILYRKDLETYER